MSKLATPGAVIWLSDGTQADDVAWMLEGMNDDEVSALTDEQLREIAQANADVRNDYDEDGEIIDEKDVDDAVIDLRRIINNRLA